MQDPNIYSKEYEMRCKREKEASDARLKLVLNTIKAEMHATAEMHENGNYYLRDEWIDEIVDKYCGGRK